MKINLNKVKIFSAILILPVLEIAFAILLARVLGTWQTLGLVLLSTLVGLIFWQRAAKRMYQRSEELRNQYGEEIKKYPADIALISLADSGSLMVAVLCFLAPGFITDLFGYIAVIPAVKNWFLKMASKDAPDIAELHGISFEEFSKELKKISDAKNKVASDD